MNKVAFNRPVLICLYGFPGSGKSYVARNLAEDFKAVHVNGDRIRSELFENPRYDNQENAIVMHLMNYMAEEFLKAGASVIYDTNAFRASHRHRLREFARQHKSAYLLIWLQVDIESAFYRTQNRDRRTADDKYAEPHSRMNFDKQIAGMQNPQSEDYLVISGKHTFATQKSAILNRLYQMGVVISDTIQTNVAVPGLVNLVPNPSAGRVDLNRRNINIR